MHRVADVRRLRGSNAMPQFNEARLRRTLLRAGIEYLPIQELSGRRPKQADPWPRNCWRNRSFANYADFMRTPEFREGVRMLLAAARGVNLGVMCAEAVPWRCHRSLIADYLVVEKHRRVTEIVGTRARPHQLTACARIVRGKLTYSAPP